MGASHTKSKKNRLKYIAHLEQSYSCYINADPNIKLQLRKHLIEACAEGNCDDVVNLLQLGVPVDSSVLYSQFYRYSTEDIEINTLYALLPEQVESTYRYTDLKSLNLRQKRVKVLDVLVEYGINLNLKDRDGQTVLHNLCKVAFPVDFSLFKKLVQLGCNIHSIDNACNSLLHCCCLEEKLYNKKAIVKYLLENGLDPNLQNSSGDTAVHLSAKCSNDAHIKLLMEHNGDVNIQNFIARKTPLHLAIESSHGRPSGLHLDASLGCTTIRTLLNFGANVNLLDNRRISAFGEALNQKLFVPYSSNELCQEFINRGADLNAGDSSKNTILHICYKYYLMEAEERQDALFRVHADVEKYVKLGASVNVKNSSNYYPVEYIIHYIPLGNTYSRLKLNKKIPFLYKSLKYHIEAGLNVKNISGVNINKLQRIHSLMQNELAEDPSWNELVNMMSVFGMNFLEDQEMSLQSLKRICANLIRISLRPNAVLGLPKLEIPLSIKNYIIMIR